mgnify:FL=1
MYMKSLIPFLVFCLLPISCSKKKEPIKPTFDQNGKETKECSVRAGNGRGGYQPLGRMNERDCHRIVSQYCKKPKYQQVHRRKGFFARGKFGSVIMIGTCE